MAHDPEVRAAVMAALLQGQAVTAVAEEYKVPTSTVSRWKEAKRRAREAVGKDADPDVGGLLLEYLRENLETLRAQARAFRDLEWLRGQEAADVAVLHGVLTDKAVRLLEALEGSPVPPATNGRNRLKDVRYG